MLDNHSKEQEIQNFIENNPILFSHFSPKLMKFKAPATAHYNTDFALLNESGELLLIEIEKPSTPLFTKNGNQHSKLIQAIGQVERWLQEARHNKMGLVNDLGIEGVNVDSVHNIRGVLIAGRRISNYTEHLSRLGARSDIDFYTYDDLLDHMRHLTQKVQDM